MKHVFLAVTLLCSFFLTGCATRPYQVAPQQDLSRETWPLQINTDPNQWLTQVDSWFLNGDPNRLEQRVLTAPKDEAITTMAIRASNFHYLVTQGHFQVQITGNQKNNTVRILGTNTAVRQVAVDLDDDTLIVHDAKPCSKSKVCPTPLTDNVIVQIGVRTLNGITNRGNSNIYGRNISSEELAILSTGKGDIMLVGDMALHKVRQLGSGTITLIGINTPALTVQLKGLGNINMSGQIGVQSILNTGGTLNIIGAQTDALTIQTSNHSHTQLYGVMNVNNIIASKQSDVNLYWVNSNELHITILDQARIGLAGKTNTLQLISQGQSRFNGQYLRNNNAYIRTYDTTHANINATQKMFLSASNKSSVYVFDTPNNIISSFITDDAVMIPLNIDLQSAPSKQASIPWNNPRDYSYNALTYK